MDGAGALDDAGDPGAAAASDALLALYRGHSRLRNLHFDRHEWPLQLALEVLLHTRVQSVGVAFLGVAQEGQGCDARRRLEVFQFAEDHSRAVYVARLELLQGRQDRLGDAVIFCACGEKVKVTH